jgi:hypothetical protein
MLLLTINADAQNAPVSFVKKQLTTAYYCDGVTSADVNRDGHLDVIAGPVWYAGPAFDESNEIYPAVALPPDLSPSNCMLTFAYDFNQDGWVDVLVMGRVHKHEAFWYENPKGENRLWAKHFVFERVQGESPTLQDVTGDGKPEIICHWQNRWGWLAPDWNRPTEPWEFQPIGPQREWPQFYHGTGVGDVNDDGRADLIINEGWFEHPSDADTKWNFQEQRYSPQRGGAQMYAVDIDLDGDNDVVSSLHGHEWGLAWFEQTAKRPDGLIDYTQHTLMGTREEESKYGVAFSQPHALEVADIDGDGRQDIVIGKRRWAHGPDGDVEPSAAPVLYWFRNIEEHGKTTFVPHLIDDESGVGVQICTVDLNEDGIVDIMTASKLGTFVFIGKR